MQAVAEHNSASPNLIVFPASMGKRKPVSPSDTDPSPQGFHPPTHGNWAQWAAIVAAIILPFILRHYDGSAAQDAENFNLRVDSRIDAKLNPAVDRINDHIDKKVDPLSEKIDRLTERVARLEGPDGRIAKLETRTSQQASLAKILDPSRTLTTIKAELQVAQANRELLPVSDLNDYRNVVQALPASAQQYWATVAAIINYQSFVNQLKGEAPDPDRVSSPCVGLTNEGRIHSFNNTIIGVPISNCVVDLDTKSFSNLTFKNSVIRYHGGSVTLANVSFVNCRFVLDISASAPANPQRNRLLMTLLNAPDIRAVTVPSTRSPA